MTFTNWDSAIGTSAADTKVDLWLGSRIPEMIGGVPAWQAISSPPLKDSSHGGVPVAFESPYLDSTWTNTLGAGYSNANYNTRLAMAPTFITINSPSGAGSAKYPAFTVGGRTYLAANASGDGMADAGLWRIPGGQINGISYYAAVRVIDNNSAINASMAYKVNDDYTTYPTPTPPAGPQLAGNYWPTNINLASIMIASATGVQADIERLNNYRINGAFTGPVTWAIDPPVDDNGANRTDFAFISPYDLLWQNLGRRPTNPAFYTGGLRMRSLSTTDSLALAYHFILRNSSGATSTVESNLLTTLVGPANANSISSAYGPDEAATAWFPGYAPGTAVSNSGLGFNYSSANFPSGNYNRRPLLVARNPVSNTTAVASVAAVGASGYPSTPVTPNLPVGTVGGTQMQAYGNAGVKTSINTAPFEELWRAYWNVMCDTAVTTGAPGDTVVKGMVGNGAAVGTNPIYDPYIPATGHALPAAYTTYYGAKGTYHPLEMFRSPLREENYASAVSFDNKTTRMDAYNVMLLRSALAAINTVDLRHQEYDAAATNKYPHEITSRTIQLQAYVNNAPEPVEVVVYGNRPQLFITEVYAENENVVVTPAPAVPVRPKGYVAIELYNPYDFPMPLDNWQLGVMDRRPKTATPAQASPYPTMKIVPITGFSMPAGKTVPAKGYVVLENYNGGAADGTAAILRPPGITVSGTSIYVKNLHEVFADPATAGKNGGELVILRPRRLDGTLTKSTVANNIYDETTATASPPLIQDLVPVDQFDFSGSITLLSTPPPAGASFTAIHYARGSDNSASNASGQAWKFIYPGRYDGSKTTGRVEGTQIATFLVPDPTNRLPVGLTVPAEAGRTRWLIQLHQQFPADPVVQSRFRRADAAAKWHDHGQQQQLSVWGICAERRFVAGAVHRLVPHTRADHGWHLESRRGES